MTPEEKAQQLIMKFVVLTWTDAHGWQPDYVETKRICQLVCDEVLGAIPMYTGNLNPKWKYWNEVKQSIEIL